MTGRVFLAVNILLLLLFGYKLLDLSSTLKYKGGGKSINVSPDFVEIKRSAHDMDDAYRNIFGLTTPLPEKSAGQKGKGGPLNELLTGDLILRIRGIFISGGLKYTVISLTNKKTRKSEEKKLYVGDKVDDFSITDIRPGAVRLGNGSDEKLTLRIFKEK